MATLLVGDASVTVHRVVELTFSNQDIEVISVSDGEQAVARIAAEPPDLVLVDVALPTRSGYEVCERVKHTPHLAHIPVLLLTGAFEPVDDSRARQVRWDGVVVKPFEPQRLAARVHELLAGRRGSSSDVMAGGPRAIDRLGLRGTAPTRAAQDRPETAADEASNTNERFDSEAASNPALDDYFEQLDSALSSRRSPAMRQAATAAPAEATGAAEHFDVAERRAQQRPGDDHVDAAPAATAQDETELSDADVPTLERVLSNEPPVEPGSPRRSMSQHSPIGDGLSASSAAGAGEADVPPVRLVSDAERVGTDALIDAITQRVLQRLSADGLDRVVATAVSDVAERLVREEIARLARAEMREMEDHTSQSPKPKSQASDSGSPRSGAE